jgi:mannose-6-phosphate isomerase-like protein (cupin superfamily)
MEATVRRRGEGKAFARPASEGSVTIKITEPASTTFETERAAGDARGPGMHAHPGFDETFYVVSGEWEFVADGRTFVADAGTTVYLPAGIFHSYRSTGRLEGRLFGIAVPGGIEDLFEEAAQSTATGSGGFDLARHRAAQGFRTRAASPSPCGGWERRPEHLDEMDRGLWLGLTCPD